MARLLALLCLAACGPLRTGHAEPAPVPGQALTTWVVQVEGRSELRLYVRNDTDHVYRLTALALSSCRNIGAACGEHAIDVLLCPGESGRVLTVHPEVPPFRERVYFDWDYEARSYEPGEPVVGARCGASLGGSS